jgi:hypothetical protein
MFSIGFTDDPLEYPFEDPTIAAAPGMLMLGKSEEEFLANLSVWNKAEYWSHWMRELKALVEGSSKAALVVSYNDPRAASNIEIWRLYLDGEWAHFQNQLLWYDSLPIDFEISRMSQYIEDRTRITDDGDHISE